MADRVRVGFIGTSWWMDLAHFPIFKADARVDMAAVCGRNRERAQEMAAKYDIAEVYTDYRDMIEHGQLDAIVVAGPDDLHYPMTMRALDAGLHVICEKPLALNAADAKAMYAKAEAKGVCHMTFFTWRAMPHYRYMRQLLDQGVIGRPYHAHFRFMMGFALSPGYKWRFDPARANGVLGDSGSHMISIAQYLVGDVAQVSAQLATCADHEGPDGQPIQGANDSAQLLLEFSNGAQGIIDVSAVAKIDGGAEQSVAIYGETGSLVASLTFPTRLRLWQTIGDEPAQEVTMPDEYLAGYDLTQPLGAQLVPIFTHQPIGCRHFIDSILAGQPTDSDLYVGWQVQEVIDAAIASHASGQRVPVRATQPA